MVGSNLPRKDLSVNVTLQLEDNNNGIRCQLLLSVNQLRKGVTRLKLLVLC